MIRAVRGRAGQAVAHSEADLGPPPAASHGRWTARRRANLLVRGSTTLLVASTGGHLKQLHRLHSRLAGVHGPFRWVTFDSPQSRSLLAGETVEFVPFVGARDPLNVLRNAPEAHRMMRDHDIANGGQHRSRCRTSVLRARPSPRASLPLHRECGPQRGTIRDRSSRRAGSPASFSTPNTPTGPAGSGTTVARCSTRSAPTSRGNRPTREIQRVVVTLGTFRGYGFGRLVRRLLDVLPPRAEVLWQTGDTDTSDLGVEGHYAIPDRDLTQAIREADVVVAHAGVGTALATLEVGKCPVLVPRRLAHGEHVDDHQTQIARELGARGLSRSVEADALALEDLLAAARRRVTALDDDQPFRTCGTQSVALAG